MGRWTPWLGAVLAASLTGCTRTDTAHQERRRTSDTANLAGTVAGMPVDLRVEATRTETVTAETQATTDLPALAPLAQALPSVSALAAPGVLGPGAVAAAGTGGLLGPLAGILGLGAAAFAWWRNRRTSGVLGRVVAGIEQAKAALPAPAVDALHATLSRRLDTSDKARIRRVRAGLP
jgi:hypothetical protein